MPDIPILQPPVQHWQCQHCNTRDVTRGLPNRMHNCPGLGGIVAPLVLEEDARRTLVRARVREDYVGKDTVQADDEGRPIMAVETLREDGSNDVAVLATCVDVEFKATT